MKLHDDLIEKAKRVNLSLYLETVVRLSPQKQRGDSVFYYSPFRQETQPSLHVTNKDGIWVWYDFGSSNHRGDAIEFVRLYRGCTFREAVEELLQFSGEGFARSVFETNRKPQTTDFYAEMKKMRRILRVRMTYGRLTRNNVLIMKYFTDRWVRFHEEMGCRIYTDFKEQIHYLAIPLPNVENLRGLELREMCSLDKELEIKSKQRKSFGVKTLWLLKRDTSRILLAESILDALAGEVLMGDDRISLASLNGVSQIGQLESMLDAVKPRKLVVSMDNDKAGKDTLEVIKGMLEMKKIPYEVWNTETKDLFRELHKVDSGGKQHVADTI